MRTVCLRAAAAEGPWTRRCRTTQTLYDDTHRFADDVKVAMQAQCGRPESPRPGRHGSRPSAENCPFAVGPAPGSGWPARVRPYIGRAMCDHIFPSAAAPAEPCDHFSQSADRNGGAETTSYFRAARTPARGLLNPGKMIAWEDPD